MWGRKVLTGTARINSVLGSFNSMIEDLAVGIGELHAENTGKQETISKLEQEIQANLNVMTTATTAKANIESLLS